MLGSRARGWRVLAGTTVGAAGLVLTTATQVSADPANYPTAYRFAGMPTVGALFHGPTDSGSHYCSASVVDSNSQDLILTAAHCVTGRGTSLVFVPDYRDGTDPYGLWDVTAAYADSAWISKQNSQDDFAFLRVKPGSGQKHTLQQEVGGNRLTINRSYKLRTRVVGYTEGNDDEPIRCTNGTYDYYRYVGFHCYGYVGGTSGGPFLVDINSSTDRGDVDGVIGGLHQGGCDNWTSYSSYFGPAVQSLYNTANAGQDPAGLPAPKSDGCP